MRRRHKQAPIERQQPALTPGRRPGAPLTSAERAVFEPAFGHSFADVEITGDSKLPPGGGATSGRTISLGRRSGVDAAADHGLLAHELAHVVQQSKAVEAAPATASRDHAAERQARRAAAAALVGTAVPALDAPSTGRAPQTYVPGEHAQFGDAQRNIDVNGVLVSYGELIAMGDFFERAEDMFAEPVDRLGELVKLIREDEAKPGSVSDERWDAATGGRYLKLAQKNVAHFSPPDPRLVPAAGTSKVDNQHEWEGYHLDARSAAFRGDRDRALAISAFADHFLTDAFSAGHLVNKPDVMDRFRTRMPKGSTAFYDAVARLAWADPAVSTLLRQFETTTYEGIVLRPNIDSASVFSALLKGIDEKEPGLLDNAVALAVHNRLNETPGGIEVENKYGKWPLSGDGTLNEESRKMGRKAVAEARGDIMTILRTRGKATSFEPFEAVAERVWGYVPRPTVKGAATVSATAELLTDPAQRDSAVEIAAIIAKNIGTIVRELVARKVLKRA